MGSGVGPNLSTKSRNQEHQSQGQEKVDVSAQEDSQFPLPWSFGSIQALSDTQVQVTPYNFGEVDLYHVC